MPLASGLDMHQQRAAGLVARPEHRHITETDQQLADERGVNFHRGSRSWRRREPPESQGPCTAPGTPTSPSDPKRQQSQQKRYVVASPWQATGAGIGPRPDPGGCPEFRGTWVAAR